MYITYTQRFLFIYKINDNQLKVLNNKLFCLKLLQLHNYFFQQMLQDVHLLPDTSHDLTFHIEAECPGEYVYSHEVTYVCVYKLVVAQFTQSTRSFTAL